MLRKASARQAGTKTSQVAVDLSATMVRVVEIEWTTGTGPEDEMRVVRRGEAPLPPDIWHDLSAHREAMATAIREALSAAGIVAKVVVACLPRRLVTLRFVHLPPATPEQMRGMVTLQAQEYILFSLDEVILDYHILPEPLAELGGADVENMNTVLLAAARRSLIADMMAVFDRAGLELQQLSISALALAEHLRNAVDTTALIDVEPGEMDVAVVAEGRLLFTRATALEANQGTPESAEWGLVEEVARSFTSYVNEFRHRPPMHVYLTGAGLPNLAPKRMEHALSDALDLPVTRRALLPGGQDDPDMGAYARAIGMALQSRSRAMAPINLVPDERAEQRARLVRRRRQRTAIIGVSVLIFFAAWAVQVSLTTQSKLRKATLAANTQLQAAAAHLNDVKKQADHVQATVTELSGGLDRNHPVVDVLAALSHRLPQSADIWLTQFAFDRGGNVTVHGETKSASAATSLVLSLQKAGAFKDVRLTYMGDALDTGTTALSAGPAPVPAASKANAVSVPQSALPGLPGLPAPGGAARPPAPAPPSPAPPAVTAPTPPVHSPPPDAGQITSFIITCVVNPNAKNLLPGDIAKLKPAKQAPTAPRAAPKAAPVDSGDNSDDTGALDEGF